jgi:hypothetical protein
MSGEVLMYVHSVYEDTQMQILSLPALRILGYQNLKIGTVSLVAKLRTMHRLLVGETGNTVCLLIYLRFIYS